MFESEPVWCEEIEEQFSEAGYSINTKARNPSLTARRKIEQLRELQQLRVWLDDPDIDELDELG